MAWGLSDSERLTSLYLTINSKNFSYIPYLFEKLVLQEEDRKKIESRVSDIISNHEVSGMGKTHIIFEEDGAMIECKETRKCYLAISRIINAANLYLIGLGKDLLRRARRGGVDRAKALLKYPISPDVLGEAVVEATRNENLAVLNKLKWRIEARKLQLDDRFFHEAIHWARQLSTPIFFQNILTFPISLYTLMSLLIADAEAKKGEYLEMLKVAIEENLTTSDPPHYLGDIDRFVKATDPLLVTKYFEWLIPAQIFGKIFIQAVTSGRMGILVWIKAILKEKRYSLNPEDFQIAIDEAFKTGAEQMVKEVLDFPVLHIAKVDSFKKLTLIAAKNGHFSLLYLHFSLWKIRMNDEKIGEHATSLRDAVTRRLARGDLLCEQEFIGSLKCAAMGNFYAFNPFYGPEYLEIALSDRYLSDADLESIFEIALEYENIEAIGSIIKCMSPKMRKSIAEKTNYLMPHLMPLRDIVLSHMKYLTA